MERQSLLSSTQKYRQALEEQASSLKENAISVAIQGAIFGGLAIGAWLLLKSLTPKTKKEENSRSNHMPVSAEAGIVSGIVASIQGAIASFLLSIAREKIMEVIEKYLDKQNASAREAS
jgi:hypothetical protein